MARVRQFLNDASGANPDTFVFPANVVSGSVLFALINSSVTTEGVTSITDDDGNTWTEAFDTVVGSNRFEIWKAPSGASGSLTITITWSAHTSAKRVHIVEVLKDGTLSNGNSDTHEVTVGEDPLTLASITASGNGVAFCMLTTDTAHTLTAWAGTPFFFDMGGGTATRAGFAETISGESVAPTLNVTTTETGDSIIMEFVDSGAAGGGGEHSFTF